MNPLIKSVELGAGAARRRYALAGGWSDGMAGGHEANCSGTWLETSAELEAEAEAARA